MPRDRDSELEELQKELAAGTPYIEPPDPPSVSGLLCWLDRGRVCGASCVAYNLEELDDTGMVRQGPNKCLVLSNMATQTASTAALVAISKRKLQTVQAQQAGIQPPNPFGPSAQPRGPHEGHR